MSIISELLFYTFTYAESIKIEIKRAASRKLYHSINYFLNILKLFFVIKTVYAKKKELGRSEIIKRNKKKLIFRLQCSNTKRHTHTNTINECKYGSYENKPYITGYKIFRYSCLFCLQHSNIVISS
jgi:uncharacterized phage-associated protein